MEDVLLVLLVWDLEKKITGPYSAVLPKLENRSQVCPNAKNALSMCTYTHTHKQTNFTVFVIISYLKNYINLPKPKAHFEVINWTGIL